MQAPRQAASLFARCVTVLAVAVIAIGLGAAPALAAPILVTSPAITVSRDAVIEGGLERVDTTFSGCIPDSAAAGDTFTLTLPQIMSGWPSGFPINAQGTTVLDVSISSTSPAVATFTLTSAGAALSNVCFSSVFGGNSGQTQAGNYTVDYLLGGTLVASIPFAVQPPNPDPGFPQPPTEPTKYGAFEDSDECTTTTSHCLSWWFRTASGPHGIVTVVDPAPAAWSFECSWTQVRIVTFPGNANPTWGPILGVNDGGPVSLACAPSSTTWTFDTSVLGPGQSFEFAVDANAAFASGAGGMSYSNAATYTVQGQPVAIDNTLASRYVGGSATGDGLTMRKLDLAGNDANTPAEAVALTSGGTALRFVVANSGTSALTGVRVSDVILQGGGTLADVSCDFSLAVGGAPAGGVAWSGPFPSHTAFACTATLAGAAGLSADRATVTATGAGPVAASDEYWARTPTPVTPPLVIEPAPTPAVVGPPPADTMTPATMSAVPSLASTGSSAGTLFTWALCALALGGTLIVVSRRRRWRTTGRLR